MWVILTKYFTYHTGTFLIRLVAGVAYAEHTIEYATVNRLKTITHIRQCASHNDRHGVVNIA